MLRRLCRLTIALSLSLGAIASTADARTFAGAPVPVPITVVDDTPAVSAAQRARLKKVLAARRAKNLAAFRAYVRAGVYPHNTETPGELNIWIDDDGRRCAAAQMIWASGERELVTAQAALDNFIRLASVTEGPLLDWILTSGLTHDEVVLIQRPFAGRPGRPNRPGVDWRIAADRQLRAKYDRILRELARSKAASLEAAVDAVAAHPDLVAELLRPKRA